ncbi:MAG TPA: protein-glutamate O-methyltransferase CheR [Noviherbaspirillum sp.]|nr:protein-glutamate O-methyltransferase CheR [Noviherbaspirillum sp.]
MNDREFGLFQRFIHDAAGISLAPSKKSLVGGRLARRVQQCAAGNYAEYFRLLESGTAPEEVQTAIDLLTTNETYFFREAQHFERLREHANAASARQGVCRVWSAACSSGEEPYSIAMVLAESLGAGPWEVVGTDISRRVLEAATRGLYPIERGRHIPHGYLQRYCLKGINSQQGTLLVHKSLRDRVLFMQANLNESLPHLGMFDVIFLRNVMIYFNDETKRGVVERVLSLLKPGGHLYIGHSETLNGLDVPAVPLAPSVYLRA